MDAGMAAEPVASLAMLSAGPSVHALYEAYGWQRGFPRMREIVRTEVPMASCRWAVNPTPKQRVRAAAAGARRETAPPSSPPALPAHVSVEFRDGRGTRYRIRRAVIRSHLAEGRATRGAAGSAAAKAMPAASGLCRSGLVAREGTPRAAGQDQSPPVVHEAAVASHASEGEDVACSLGMVPAGKTARHTDETKGSDVDTCGPPQYSHPNAAFDRAELDRPGTDDLEQLMEIHGEYAAALRLSGVVYRDEHYWRSFLRWAQPAGYWVVEEAPNLQ